MTVGVLGGVCEFAYARYLEVVVPAFRAGEQHPVIRRAIEVDWSRSPFAQDRRYDGVAEVMAHFDATLSECDLGRESPVSSLHEDLIHLFELVLSRETVVAYANLARSGNDLWDLFDIGDHPMYHDDEDDGFPATSEHPRLQELLMRLDRTFSDPQSYWVNDTYAAGIAGWLDPARTRELASLLPRPGSTPFRELQGRFWAVLERAVANENGLLWGRNLTLFHQPEVLFAAGEALPVEIK